jgi:hypothetical protein
MKKISVAIIIVVSIVLLASCIHTNVREDPLFNENDFASILQSGDGSITGQTFRKTASGDMKYVERIQVALVPKTPYTDKMMNVLAGYGLRLSRYHDDSSYMKYVRTDDSDFKGRFAFFNVAAGEYYVYCIFIIPVGRVPAYGLPLKDRFNPLFAQEYVNPVCVYEEVHIKPGESVKVLLTPD